MCDNFIIEGGPIATVARTLSRTLSLSLFLSLSLTHAHTHIYTHAQTHIHTHIVRAEFYRAWRHGRHAIKTMQKACNTAVSTLHQFLSLVTITAKIRLVFAHVHYCLTQNIVSCVSER